MNLEFLGLNYFLQSENFILLAKKFIFDDFFSRLSLFKLLQPFMKIMTAFQDGYSCTPHKFNKAVGLQFFNEFICLFTMSCGFKNRVILPDGNGPGTKIASAVFPLLLFPQWHQC